MFSVTNHVLWVACIMNIDFQWFIFYLIPLMDEKSTLSGKIILNTDIIAKAATELSHKENYKNKDSNQI